MRLEQTLDYRPTEKGLEPCELYLGNDALPRTGAHYGGTVRLLYLHSIIVLKCCELIKERTRLVTCTSKALFESWNLTVRMQKCRLWEIFHFRKQIMFGDFVASFLSVILMQQQCQLFCTLPMHMLNV